MPYRREGSSVYVQRAGRWQLLKKHATEEKAQRHLAALQINVLGKYARGEKKKP